MQFGDFLGNERLKSGLSAAFSKGAVSHCYLICGPHGSGKHTLARLLAAAMECQSDAKPCLRCAACRKVLSGIHPDLITVDDPDRASVSVATIRAASADAMIRPNEGLRKIYLLPRADALLPPAQNALLKIIEEPPAYGAFLLLSENPDALLPTVRSRCVELALSPLSWEEAAPVLRARVPDAEERALRAAWQSAGGWLGQALEILQGGSAAETAQTFAQAYASGDPLELLRFLTAQEKRKRADLEPELAAWRALLIEALRIRSGASGGELARTIASRVTAQQLYSAADAVARAQEFLSANGNVAAICAYLCVKLHG